MIPYAKAAELHKRQITQLIQSIGVQITLRFPPTKVGTGDGSMANKVFGARQIETTTDSMKDRHVQVIWSNDYLRPETIVPGDVSDPLAPLASAGGRLDAVLRAVLSEVLIDPNALQGQTLFDTCKEIVYEGGIFEVTGTKRTGLPPIGPYELWVGLRQISKKELTP